MPYLKIEDRERAVKLGPWNGGSLNYKITAEVDYFLTLHGLSYQSINEAIGALECAKLELYRRIAAPYEDTKKVINGDVYSQEILTNEC